MSSDDDIRAFLARARRAGTANAAAVVSLDELGVHRGLAQPAHEPQFRLDQLAGRLVEFSAVGASATVTAAVGLVLEAQELGDPVAWITRHAFAFYPPDLADSGVDLDALVVVRIPQMKSSTNCGSRAGDPEVIAGIGAVERLLRSGAFALVVFDVGSDAEVPVSALGRLVKLAQRHDTAVVLLTEKPERNASMGSLVSLRAEALRKYKNGVYELEIRALKDKRRGPGWLHRERVKPPAGLK